MLSMDALEKNAKLLKAPLQLVGDWPSPVIEQLQLVHALSS